MSYSAGGSSAADSFANAGAAGPSTNSKAAVPRTPSNLRFQRRQSERAFYEGAYREREQGAMDYGAGQGTSPWASSPDASRTSFQGDSTTSVPRADLPGPAVGGGFGDDSGGPAPANGDSQGYAYPGQSQAGGWTPEQQHQWQQYQAQQQHPQQAQHEAGQRPSGDEPRRPQSARYHGVPPQQRQHAPNYKLQAKITGMERGGKKDPILKFDVYVCHLKLCVGNVY
jgi:hypothetical protein